MCQSRRTQLNELLACSRRMKEMACSGDWEAVARLQAEHQRLNERFFAEPVDDGLATECAAAIREMLLNNQRIAGLGEREREDCVRRKREIDKRRDALRAYADNGG